MALRLKLELESSASDYSAAGGVTATENIMSWPLDLIFFFRFLIGPGPGHVTSLVDVSRANLGYQDALDRGWRKHDHDGTNLKLGPARP